MTDTNPSADQPVLPDRPAKLHIPDLDILRGLAAIMMVTNHLAVKVLPQEQWSNGFLGNLTFIGSFAPVIFFLVTGMGYGIQSQRQQNSSRWLSVLNKVAILIVADLLMYWSVGHWMGLDFLGFIALSMLLLEMIRLRKQPILYCATGIVFISGLRFIGAPLITKLFGYSVDVPIVHWILGNPAVPGISYPLSPWIAYPLLGFVVGAGAVHDWETIQNRRWQMAIKLTGLALFPILIGFIIAWKGGIFFRWGTMNLNFYIVSFAAILFSIAGSLAICATPKLKPLQSALSLPGIASFAIVPIHYFLIGLLASAGVKDLNEFSFCLMLLILTALTFLLSQTLAEFSRKLSRIKSQKTVWLMLVAAIVLFSGATLLSGQEGALLPLFTRTDGQLLLCLLFAVRSPFEQRSLKSQAA